MRKSYLLVRGKWGAGQGDLIKRVDPIGNVTCYRHDALHRLLSQTYTVSSPTIATPNKCFVYDAAIDGNTVTNTKGRLAEAYTTTSACSQTTLPSNTTDVAFGYSLRGELTDAYEKTPDSGSTSNPYNHTTASFWASGALNTLGGPVIPTVTYAVDPEGRTTTVSASGTNPVTSVTYNLYTNPPQQKVTFGSGDSDTFNFDANTFRLTQYQFKVGTQTVTGAVNWNANGSLGSLNINDQFNSSNTQNCTYTADDLARINKGDCGTIWGQTFSYDAFGNVSKTKITGSGATSFNPTYQSSPSITNRISCIGGTGPSCTGGTAPTYDANGNSLNDTFRTFTWDGENRPVTIGSVSLTYDALGRMVEQSVTAANTEIVYSPSGGKLSLMNGTSLIKAFAPLSGGATAVYTSASGPAYYRHTDHLGSSRFASTPSQTLYSDTAYSPFGEPYASSGAIDNSFTGQNQDTLAGLYDFLAREHDPNQGRWTQPDPSGVAAVDPANPQSWNRYAYVLNSPTNLTDPLGLYEVLIGNCVYDEVDFFVDGVYDSSDFTLIGCSSGGGSGGGGSGGGGLTPPPSTPPIQVLHLVAPTPCKATVGQRIATGVQGGVNLGMAGVKTAGLGTLDVLATVAAPETGGLTLVGASVVTTYAVTNIGGQALSGMGQLYSAVTGDAAGGEQVSQAGDILSGPVAGLTTLVATGDPELAQRNANIESFATGVWGARQAPGLKERIASSIDAGLAAVGLGGTGCHP